MVQFCGMWGDPNCPKPEYLIFIDEAGDPGYRQVKPIDPKGSSEWFTLGAVVVAAHREREVVDWVREIKWSVHQNQRPDLHYRHLGLTRRQRACDILATKDCRLFAVASHKVNLRGWKNDRAAVRSSQDPFYNWCVRVLLERVTAWCFQRAVRDYGAPKAASLVFSSRGGTRFSQLCAYHEYLRRQSNSGSLFHPHDIKWDVLHPDLYHSIPHASSAGAQLADIVASAFFQAADANASGWSPASVGPAASLGARLGRNNDIIAGQGLTLMPLRRQDRNLSSDQRRIFETFGYSF